MPIAHQQQIIVKCEENTVLGLTLFEVAGSSCQEERE